MKNKIKKALSVTLIVIVMLTSAPLSAFDGLELPGWHNFSISASAVSSGSCGNNLTWTFDEPTGTLTISGTGEMDDYSAGNTPWILDAPSITTVIFNKGITRIGANSFKSCSYISKVVFSETITSIGDSAFAECDSLVSVRIPDSVKDIGSYAFDSCSSLKNVVLSKSLLTLGGRAFGYTAIETIEIPKSLESCSEVLRQGVWEWSYILDNNEYWLRGGPFYCCEKLETATFETGTIRIPSFLFRGCTGLKEIKIPDTVTSINGGAFAECLRLSSVTIGEAVKTIGDSAFLECASLANIVIPDSVTEIASYAFDSCTALKNINLSDSLKSLGGRAFGYTAIKSVMIPKSLQSCSLALRQGVWEWSYDFDGTEYWLKGGPFYCCEELKTATIESGITNIPSFLFRGCTGLKNIEIPDTVTNIGEGAFAECFRLTDITVGNAVTKINTDAFLECISLEEITIPDGVTEIGYTSFRDCCSLKSVEIPDTVTSMGHGVFYNCMSLADVKFSENVEIMPKEAFKGCSSLKEVVLPEKTKEIGACAFQNCINLEKIYIPCSTKSIGNQAFMGCEILSDVKIVDYSIKSIGSDVFKDCFGLASIILPKGLTKVGSQAFMNCTELTSVTIPESVVSIDSTSFSYPQKTTIYGKAGSYAETFANEYGFKFVDISIPAQGIILKEGSEIINLYRGETYRAEFEFYPENANDVVTLTASNTKVRVEGMDIYAQSTGDTIITATTSSGMTYEFTVHIRDVKSFAITTPPNKMIYVLGEDFDNLGMTVTVNYSDNTSEIVTDYVVSGFDSTVEGICTVTVQWLSPSGNTYKKTLEVKIVDSQPKVTGIYVASLPDKIEYALRESFDTTGLVIMANYTDGSVSAVTAYTVSGYNALKTGEQTITVTYGEFTTTFTVMVISPSQPDDPVITTYTVTWVVDGKTTSQTYKSGDRIVQPSTPSKSGYTFKGWTPDVPSTMPAYNLTFTAVFEKKTDPVVPSEPLKADIINQPTQTTISYGDAIVLHVDASKIPAGGKVKWTANNGNFNYSANGNTCRIDPNKSGITTFTATIYDAQGNAVSMDEQTMTSKAGFFDKIIAFFKKLFGLTKTIPQIYNCIF